MTQVELKVYLIAKSTLTDQVDDWLHDLGATQFSPTNSAAGLIELAGRRCYKSFQLGMNPNVTKIRTELAAYIDNILQSGHGSVLEHASYSFAIENVSRVFTAEMNRHRAGMAISEGSMRYIRFDDIPFWMPQSVQECETDDAGLADKKAATRAIFENAFRDAEFHYKRLLSVWSRDLDSPTFSLKKQITSMIRRIIPIGVATGGVWTGNIRALRHIVTMRCDESAEEEICIVAHMMLGLLRTHEPELFGDFDETGKPKWRKV